MIVYEPEGYRTMSCTGWRKPPHSVVLYEQTTDEEAMATPQICGLCSLTDEEIAALHPVVRQFAHGIGG